MAKILVTGGTGYIGSHVAKALHKAGFEVRIYDDLSSGNIVNLFPEYEFIRGNILDYPRLKAAMLDVDGVIHLAAKKAVGPSMINPNEYSLNNIIGSLNVLMAMDDMNVRNIVFSSSAAVYGMPEYLPIDEKHPLNPFNYYGFTKLEVEKVMEWYDKLKGIKFTALRYFNALGYDLEGKIIGQENDSLNLLPIVLEILEGKREKLEVYGTDYDTPDGTCIRDYVHVDDLARAHVLAMKRLLNGGTSVSVNLGTNKGTSVKEIIDAVEEITGKKLSIEYKDKRYGDPAKLFTSYDKAKEVLGWEPEITDIKVIVKSNLNII